MTKEEFTAVVDQWYDPLYRFALSLCSNTDDALDFTQNAFRKLARKSDQLRDNSKAKSWLFSVVHREYIDEYRHNRRFPKTHIDATLPLVDSTAPAPRGDSIDARRAIDALSQIEERFRAPITLFYLQDFSYKEISEILEIPIGTVMSRLRRAKDRLRKILESPAQTARNTTIKFPKEA